MKPKKIIGLKIDEQMKPNKLQMHGKSQNISHFGQKRRAAAKADTAVRHRAGIRQFLNQNF